MKSCHTRARDDFPALLPDQTGQHLTHTWIVRYTFLRDVNRLNAARMRLDLSQLLSIEHAQTCQTVLASALEQSAQARHFVFIRGDHHFAAHFMPDPVHLAELDHLADPAHRQASPSRS